MLNIIDIIIFAQAAAPENPPARSQSIFEMLIPMVLMFIIMYVILIKPQHKKQKEHEEMVKTLKSGDRVMTSGGIYGKVAEVMEQTIFLRVANNVKLEINRSNVGQKLSDDNPDTSEKKVGKKPAKK